jgi:YesN/AraC family two-component response regulator
MRHVRTILVADDDGGFRDWLVGFVSELVPGDRVVGVGDGNTAFTCALELRPRTVLLDVVMPGPNGLHVATAIAQALPQTEIVILSGTDDVDATSLPETARYIHKDAGLEDRLRRLLASQA